MHDGVRQRLLAGALQKEALQRAACQIFELAELGAIAHPARPGERVAHVLAGIAGASAQPPEKAPAGRDTDLLIDWTNPDGVKWTFKARIDRPQEKNARRRAVFMFGGGFSNDIDWTTPGRFEHAGQAMQLTISGEDARDGQTLATALVADGWTVIRYASIREGDPLRAQSLAMAEAMPYPGTLDLARFMWKVLLARANFEPDRVIALGHSLGATRAVHVTEGRAAGYVLLAGAYLSPTRAAPRQISSQVLVPFGEAASDAVVSRAEAEATGAALSRGFDTIDFDRSGDLAGWELAAAQRLADGLRPEAEKFDKAGTLPWPSDQLASSKAPMLAIWGGRDEISYHGPLLEELGRRGDFRVATRYFAGLGHNLGPMEGERTGPIDPEVVSAVVQWLGSSFPGKDLSE